MDRIEATLERTAQAQARTEANLDRLAQVVGTIAASAAAHDDQIEKLVQISEENSRNWEQLRREWQAYLNTIHPKN
jgi:hypothetical protein